MVYIVLASVKIITVNKNTRVNVQSNHIYLLTEIKSLLLIDLD